MSDSYGHRRDRHLVEFIAEKRPMKLRVLEADSRHRVFGAHRCRRAIEKRTLNSA